MISILVGFACVTAYPSYYVASQGNDCETQRIKPTTVFPGMGPGGSSQSIKYDDSLELPCPNGYAPMLWSKTPIGGQGIVISGCLSYCERNYDCFSENHPYDQLVCARSGQSYARVWDPNRSDKSVCIVGCGLAGRTAAALASDIVGDHFHVCTHETNHASSLSSGVMYFPHSSDDLVAIIQQSVDETPTAFKTRFENTSGATSIANLRSSFLLNYTKHAPDTMRKLSDRLGISFEKMPAPTYYGDQKRSYTISAKGVSLSSTVQVLEHLKKMSSIDVTIGTVVNYAQRYTGAVITLSNDTNVTCDSLIFASGGFGQNTSISHHRSMTNNGVAWTKRNLSWKISEPYLAWNMEFSNGTIRWFQEQDGLYPDPNTSGFMNNLSLAGGPVSPPGYMARADYNRRAMALWATNATVFPLYSPGGSRPFQHLSDEGCSPSANYWGAFFGSTSSCDAPINGTLTNKTVEPMIIDTKASVVTDSDSHHIDQDVNIYYIGNAGAWAFGNAYIAPGNTLGFCMSSALAAVERISTTVSIMTADIGYFVIAVIIFTVSIALITLFPWTDKLFSVLNSSKTPDNHFPESVWTAVAAIHGILMTSAFVIAIIGVVDVVSANVKLNVKGEAHGTVGYISLALFSVQILFGWALLYLVTIYKDLTKVIIVIIHATSGYILAALILYQTFSGQSLANKSTLYDNVNIVIPVFVIVLISISASAINLFQWYTSVKSHDYKGII